MDSRELGLVIAQQLTDIEDLHYGFWDENSEPSILDFINSQKRYSEHVISYIQEIIDDPSKARILDVGCGTGTLIAQLLQLGYQVDGVIPSDYLIKKVKNRLQHSITNYKPKIYNCTFEAFPESERVKQYDLVFFSESFQYIKIKKCFLTLKSILKPNGRVLISDFFKSVHHGDGGFGDKSFGGGHPIKKFYRLIDNNNFKILNDVDITGNLSPNIELVDKIVMGRIYPAIQTIDDYLTEKHPVIYKILKFFYRKKMKKLKYKYFSGYRNKKTFEKYKTYLLIILEVGKE